MLAELLEAIEPTPPFNGYVVLASGSPRWCAVCFARIGTRGKSFMCGYGGGPRPHICRDCRRAAPGKP